MESKPEYASVNQISKPWACANGTCRKVLGSVYRDSRRIRHLKVVHLGLEVDAVMGVFVKCPDCGTVREWHPGDEAIQELIDRRSKLI